MVKNYFIWEFEILTIFGEIYVSVFFYIRDFENSTKLYHPVKLEQQNKPTKNFLSQPNFGSDNKSFIGPTKLILLIQ